MFDPQIDLPLVTPIWTPVPIDTPTVPPPPVAPPPPQPRRAQVVVTFTQMTVHDDADSGFNGSGEMWLDLNVNGEYLRWPGGGTVDVDDGMTVDVNQSFTLALEESQNIVINVNGIEEDDSSTNDPMGNVSIVHHGANEWGAADSLSSNAQSTCPDGCYTIAYSIQVNWQ